MTTYLKQRGACAFRFGRASLSIALIAGGLLACGGDDEGSDESPAPLGGTLSSQGTGRSPTQTAGGGSSTQTPQQTQPAECSNSCEFAFDAECDDGRPGADADVCAPGTDCGDCGSSSSSPGSGSSGSGSAGAGSGSGIPSQPPSTMSLGGVSPPAEFVNRSIQIREDVGSNIRGVTLTVCDQGLVAVFETQVIDQITQSVALATSVGILTQVLEIDLGTVLVVEFSVSSRPGRVPFQGRYTISTNNSGTPTAMLAAMIPGIDGYNEAVQGPVVSVTNSSAECADMLSRL